MHSYKNSIYIVSFFLYGTIMPDIVKKVIFVDLGGIVFHTNKKQAFKTIGFSNITKYIWHQKSFKNISQNIKNKFFTTLDMCMPWPTDIKKLAPQDETGQAVPFLMYCWLTNTMSCKNIKEFVQLKIITHPEWFSCKAEQNIIFNIATMTFTPRAFIQTQKIYAPTVELLKIWKTQGYTLIALSNWDKESFNLLESKYPDLFALFDKKIISGKIQVAKPDFQMYAIALDICGLNAQECYFIDDQEINIQAAESIGITGIHCPTKNEIKNLLAYERDNFQKILA